MLKILAAGTFLVMVCGTASAIAVAAPEIDPFSAVSAVTMLMGSLAVLTGRNKKGK